MAVIVLIFIIIGVTAGWGWAILALLALGLIGMLAWVNRID